MATAATTSSQRTLATLLRSSQVRWAVSGWIFFIAENALLSENRTYLISRLGNEKYHAVYGTFSTAATASIAYAYYKLTREKALLLVAPPRLPALAFSWACMSLGLTMAFQSLPKLQVPLQASQSEPDTQNMTRWKLQVRCPFDFAGDSAAQQQTENVQGLDRITRHPGLWSLALMFAGNAALQTSLPLRLWWMGPTAVAWLGGMHTDSRFRRGLGGTMDPWYDAQTSNVPFVALLTGRQGNPSAAMQQLIGQELKPLNALLATGVATVFVLSRGRVR